MLKYLFLIIRRITVSFFLLYAYNLVVQPLDLIIPINIITILSVSFLGVPALICFIILSVFIF